MNFKAVIMYDSEYDGNYLRMEKSRPRNTRMDTKKTH